MSDVITGRSVWATTSLPPGALLLETVKGEETLGQPFTFEVTLASDDWNIDLGALLGEPMTVHCDLPTGGTRHFNGVVTGATQLDGDGRFARYRVILRPWLWLLSYGSDCRIFQNQSIPEIVKDVFRRAGFSRFEEALTGAYQPLEYCVQYRESDLDFVSRLLEHEGIYYYFKHEPGAHTLVLADSRSGCSARPGYERVMYRPAGPAGRADHEGLSSWVMAEQIRPGAFAAADYNFEMPRTPLVTTSRKPGKYLHGDRERFDYPGHYLTYDHGESRVRMRLEQRQADGRLVRSSGNVRGLGAGNLFSLTEFPRLDQNKEHLVIGARYEMDAGRHGSSNADGARPDFATELTLVDSQIPYRPPSQRRKPRMDGPQTAVVVGKKGEEIWTDKYGRVLVQFHWDRYGLSDQQSSCWVRVAQTAAGGRWGAVMVPRVGNEVMVDFLEGDPDRPIITGQVYNAANMPPYDLALSPTQSGVKTRSTPGGNQQNFNEITFEDKLGEEELRIQAEKDQTTYVKNQQSITVGASRNLVVKQDETVTVEGNRTLTVTKTETETFLGSRTMTVAQTNTETVTGKQTGTYNGGRLETVDNGDTLIVNGSDKTTTVHGSYNVTADSQFQVQQGGNSLLVKDQIKLESVGEIQLTNGTCRLDLLGGVATLTADNEITFICGAASISLKKDGTIDINGGKMVTATGSSAGLKLEQPGATMSGSTATISGGSLTAITGDEIKFN